MEELDMVKLLASLKVSVSDMIPFIIVCQSLMLLLFLLPSLSPFLVCESLVAKDRKEEGKNGEKSDIYVV